MTYTGKVASIDFITDTQLRFYSLILANCVVQQFVTDSGTLPVKLTIRKV